MSQRIFDQRSGEERRDDPRDDRQKIMADWFKWIMAIGISAMLGYSATVNAVNARIAVLETKQQANEMRLQRIEDKIDQLLERQVELLRGVQR